MIGADGFLASHQRNVHTRPFRKDHPVGQYRLHIFTCLIERDGLDEDIVTELRNRAKDVLLTQAIASEEVLEKAEPAEDLLTMEGMDKHLALVLASKGISTMEDLAEQSIDDLLDVEGMTEEKAGELIMTARKPWFEGTE